MNNLTSKEREIFRDCYNILEKNDLGNFVNDAKAITSKYDNLDDKMLCTEMLGVVKKHMDNIRIK